MTPDRPTIVVVGLGPGDPDLVTAGTLAAIELVLEGLHLSKRLNKDAVGGRAQYRSR